MSGPSTTLRTGARGEETILVNDDEVRVLFTNRALAEAEGKLGKSIIRVMKDFVSGDSGITELAHLLQVGMEAHRKDAQLGGRMVKITDAFAILEQVGFARVAEPVMLAVSAVLDYGTSEDEADSEEGDDPNAPESADSPSSTGKRSLKTRLGLGSE